MIVKFLTSIAGEGLTAYPGEVKVIDDAEGKRLIEAGICEIASEDQLPESEMVPVEITAISDNSGKKKRGRPRINNRNNGL